MPELMLCTSSRIHPKIRRLKRKLGAEGVLSLYNLWCFCKEYRSRGILTGMESSDISEAADYSGDTDAFVGALLELRLLDNKEGVLTVHGWDKYNSDKLKKQSAKKAIKEASTGEVTTEPLATPISQSISDVVMYYKKVHPTRGRNIKPGSADWKRVRSKIKEGYSVEDLKKAIDGNKLCNWHKNVPAGHSIEFIFRNATKIEGFIERANDPSQYAEVTQIGHHKGSEDFEDGDQATRF